MWNSNPALRIGYIADDFDLRKDITNLSAEIIIFCYCNFGSGISFSVISVTIFKAISSRFSIDLRINAEYRKKVKEKNGNGEK